MEDKTQIIKGGSRWRRDKETAKKIKPLKDDELSAFSLQMALLIRAGIPAEEGLGILAEDAADEKEKTWLLAMAEEMALAVPFYQALASGGGVPCAMQWIWCG